METAGQLAGFDWNTLFQAIPARATAAALAAALAPIAGSVPTVTNYADYSAITFSPDQEERLSAWILTQLRKEPGPVRIDASGVAVRVLLRQYWPYMVGLAGAGFLLAQIMRKKGGRR